MSLLLDQNLSPRLVGRLADLSAGCRHVGDLGLDRASDEVLWEYAAQHDLVIVTKDSDFCDLSVLRGHPPKVIWLRLGNCTTSSLEHCLRANHSAILAWVADPDSGLLELHGTAGNGTSDELA